MSHPSEGTAHPRAEDDRVDSRAVVLVGVGALVIFTAAGLTASAYLHRRQAEGPPPTLPAELGATKIGLVEQRLFSGPLRGERERAVQLERLRSFGWVDRAAGVAHIPIDVAMALVAEGVRAPGSTPPDAPPLSASRGGVDAPSVPLGRRPAQGPPPRGGRP